MSMLFGNDSSDSDNEDGTPACFRQQSFHMEDIEEVNPAATQMVSDFTVKLEELWLHRDVSALEIELSTNQGALQRSCTEILLAMLTSNHMSAVKNLFPSSLSMPNMLDEIVNNVEVADALQRRVWAYVGNGDTESNRELRSFHCLLLGMCLFEVYCQANYTGPEFGDNALLSLNTLVSQAAGSPAELIHKASINALECDGDVAYPICIVPQALLLARIFLTSVSDSSRATWKHGIFLDVDGSIKKKLASPGPSEKVIKACERHVSRHWWSARAAVVHLRLLQKQSYEAIPTLWHECNDMFGLALVEFGLTNLHLSNHNYPPSIAECCRQAECLTDLETDAILKRTEVKRRILAAEVWIEAGLCQHYFSFKSKGKDCFKLAQVIVGIQTQLTSALGKRTKHQQFEVYQLYLYAKSLVSSETTDAETSSSSNLDQEQKSYKLVPKQQANGALSADADESAKNAESVVTTVEETAVPSETSGWEHAEWELGRRLVGEVVGGEEASVREVMLDSQDGGAVENILIEGGPKFTEDQNRGGELHPVDQAVLMALCLDVKNSNPVDGLTNEEMYPFVERVLQQPRNWMIHSNALLQRSWLEFERRKTMDRAMLQMQALLDQHTTKLTITQSTFKSVEESAPAHDRLRYLCCLVYPSQYELKRDLALRYLSCQVFNSALNYFKELDMWDEVVSCYQLLDKPQRAELVVRERLRQGETPYMLTALADLTQNEELYERAWLLSNKRYARAKRTLARMCFDKKQYAVCVKHMDEALAVHPLVPTAWYLKGLACMHLEDYVNGLNAFSRCVQQDMEIGEAWANMGAIYMRQGLMSQAHSSLKEALKHKRDSWQVLENLMTVCVAQEK
jgi:tetratricopeptide (TPR) repeat protein